MKNSLIVTAIAFCFAFAPENMRGINPGPRPGPVAQGGLQISLTTSGYKFVVSAPATAENVQNSAGLDGRPADRPVPTPRDSFAVSAVLTNRSNTDISFIFPNAAAAERHFKFRLLDSEGKLIWASVEAESDGPTTEETLRRRSVWRRTVLVPLRIAGAPLPPGQYTVEAVVDADKQLFASTLFEVVAPPDPDGNETGIAGQVLHATGLPLTSNVPVAPDLPVSGARIVITELLEPNAPVARGPFFWQGVTNTEGRFGVPTPPGRFRVTATLPAISLAPVPGPVPSKAVEVVVEAGRFSDVTIRFPAAKPPVPDDTGIRGLVLIGPLRPVAQPDQPNEAPLAGAQVRVEEIPLPNVRYNRPMFVWSGVTNGEGRFTVRTPAGKFRVTARQALVVMDPPEGMMIQRVANVGLPGTAASIEVMVEELAFRAVTLRLDSGIR